MNFGAFLSGCVARRGTRDVGVFAISPADQIGSMFYALVGHDWVRYSVEVDWATVGMAAHHYTGEKDLVVLSISSESDFWEVNPAGPQQRTGRISSDLSGVTHLAQVHEEIWLCGMDRIVWARDASGQWSDISAPSGRLDEGVIGFTTLAGLPDGRAVAAGWHGEIWVRDVSGWHLEDSDSNANFNALSVDEAGNVVVVGDRGALVDGRTGQWQAYSTEPSFNLQGVCHFNDQVFVCSDFEIFLWTHGRLVRETRFDNDDRPSTCLNLLPGGGLVYSQGERDIFRFDGSRWSRVI